MRVSQEPTANFKARLPQKLKTIQFANINEFMLLGGGEFILWLSEFFKENAFKVIVISSERHLTEVFTYKGIKRSFEGHLKANKTNYYLSHDIIADPYVLSLIKPSLIGISYGAAWIFKKEFIERFGGRLLNLHGTPLPKYRGGGGFTWQIMQGNRQGRCLLHQIDTGLDTGNIVKAKPFLFPRSCRTSKDVNDYYLQKAKLFLKDFMNDLKMKKNFILTEQNEAASTYWPRLATDMHGYINWQWSLKDLESFICGFDDPYMGASTFVRDKRVFLKGCRADLKEGKFHPFQNGIVYRIYGHSLYVAAQQGALVIERVLDKDSKDALGCIAVGDRFYTPSSFLDQALSYRAIYTPQGLKRNE